MEIEGADAGLYLEGKWEVGSGVMIEVFNISSWEEKPWYSTGGTRDKCLIESPEGELYYFKTSLKKEQIDYKFEFWSEIIASEVGKMLGLNVLQYDIATRGDMIGCLCRSMINGQERLTEGMNYLVGHDNTYDGDAKNKYQKSRYSYQFITDALRSFRLDKFIENIDEVIVFDAIIGNGDRHQENWAIISEYSDVSKSIEEIYDGSNNFLKMSTKKLFRFLSGPKIENYDTRVLLAQAIWDKNVRFAPIYDNGSSLGREHNDDKLQAMLKDHMQFYAYLNRGKAEIHWEGIKLNHFELVSKLLESSDKVRNTINTFKSKFNESSLSTFIQSLDERLPEEFTDYKLTGVRKDFLTKLITLRYQRLISL